MNEQIEDISNSQFAETVSKTQNPKIEEALKRINDCKTSQSKNLDLQNLNLKELPKEIYELNSLESLNLNDNPLESIEKNIEKLESLEAIELTNFLFASLPSSFSKLKNLRSIRLSGEAIREFPKEFLSLHQLVSLNLSNCQISELPKQIEILENLQVLWLFNNPIKKIDHLPNLLNKLSTLSINSTEITDYDFFDKLKVIKKLSLGGKLIIEFPKEVFNLRTLEYIHLFKAEIQYIPHEIRNLENLSELNIYGSKIKHIADSIGTLKMMESLMIGSSMVEILPASIGDLHNLKRLQLQSNALKELPSEIGQLANLVELNLYSNELSTIPTEIGDLKKLQKLDLSFNKLNFLPAELSKLTNLINLDVSNNAGLISPPKHVLENGKDAILSYLKDLIEEVNVWSSKLVIVGEGQVGKSCLLDALNDKPFEKGKPTTHALNLSQLTFEHPLKDTLMYLNVWDFGGQDIYHATHQFYLTNHSLFLLVWSARAGYEAGKIYKWLETISALAPDSPIFIVATNSAERGADLPKGDILNLYPNKIFFFEVDNEKRTGINELNAAIRYKAAGLKYMGIGRPRSWINSSKELKQTEGSYITKCNLFEIFHRNGVSKNSYESLACYLHDLGEILYYPDEEELNDTIIIKPEWVSEQIAKILDSDELSKNEGFLDKKLMLDLWSDIDFSLHDKLITLMEKFDLSYKTKDDKEISLIVEKLKYEEHENFHKLWENFPGNNEIVFKYQLDTIPAGIPTWFIARTHRFSIKVHWKFGVLLKDTEGKHLGLLTTSPERKEIWLRVKGEMPYFFFAQLRDTLELTFNRFEGLKRPAFVPCPGHNGIPCKHLFELKQLEKRLTIVPPKQVIECPEELEDINVMKLIFGLSFAPNNEVLVEEIRSEVEKIIRSQNQLQTEELIKFTHLEFIKSYQCAQEIVDITCPNIFTLKELKSDIKGIGFNNRFKLQLYCQMPGCNHSIGEPYEIDIPKEWIIAIAPYYNKMLKILQYTLPLALPGAKSVLSDLEFTEVKPYIDSVKEYGKVIKEYETGYEFWREISNSQEMNIRYIRKLLESVDPDQTWAGLKRFVSPEGHILWLCKEHYSEYKK